MPIAILVLQVCMPFKYHQCTFSFYVTYKTCYTDVWRNLYKHMHMIRTYLCLHYIDSFSFTQHAQNICYVLT